MHSLPVPGIHSLRRHVFVWLVVLLSAIPYFILITHDLEALSGWFVPRNADAVLQAPWRLLTPIFIHYTVFHLLTNVYVWWYFGSKIEERSRGELSLLLVGAAATGNAAQWFFFGPHFGGLSGVTYALLSYCWSITYLYKTRILKLDKTLSIILVVLLPLSATGLFGNFSDAAHFTGLAFGVLMAVAKYLISRTSRRI